MAGNVQSSNNTAFSPSSERKLVPKDLLPDQYKYHSIAYISKLQNRTDDNFLLEYGLYFYKKLFELYAELDKLKRHLGQGSNAGKDKTQQEIKIVESEERKDPTKSKFAPS